MEAFNTTDDLLPQPRPGKSGKLGRVVSAITVFVCGDIYDKRALGERPRQAHAEMRTDAGIPDYKPEDFV